MKISTAFSSLMVLGYGIAAPNFTTNADSWLQSLINSAEHATTDAAMIKSNKNAGQVQAWKLLKDLGMNELADLAGDLIRSKEFSTCAEVGDLYHQYLGAMTQLQPALVAIADYPVMQEDGIATDSVRGDIHGLMTLLRLHFSAPGSPDLIKSKSLDQAISTACAGKAPGVDEDTANLRTTIDAIKKAYEG